MKTLNIHVSPLRRQDIPTASEPAETHPTKVLASLFGLGFVLFLLGLPAMLLGLILACHWLILTSLLVGALGTFGMACAALLKGAQLLFRA